MSDISFNRGNLSEVSGDFATFNHDLNLAKSVILTEISTIESNWSGEEFEKAKVDLDLIKNNLEKISSNSTVINNILATTSQGFNQTKYNG